MDFPPCCKVTYPDFVLKTSVNIGRSGEDQAVAYLVTKDYKIEECNFRHGRREIDIIATKDSFLIFIEVKLRKNNDFGYPESFLGKSQKLRILEAANQYILENDWKGNIRFDIISIESENGITHFEDAFH